MSEHHGARLLYRAATGLEKALADVDGERLTALYAEAVRDVWDPWAISRENLPVLAWAMQARLWEDEWAEHTKREWTANQWHFQALRGSQAGVEMALRTTGRDFTGGYNLLEVLAPPQGFFASPSMTKDEWDAWVRQMPELRIQLAHGVGLSVSEFFAGDGVVGKYAAGRDDGPALYGRRAVLRRPGQPDQYLGMVEWRTRVERRETIDYERVSVPGLAGAAFVAGEDHVSEERFVDADELAPRIYSFQLDGSYDHVTSELHLSTIAPGLDPMNVQFERDSDVGEAGPFFFVNDHADDGFADNGRDAYEMLADRIYLMDPAIAVPMTDGVSFVGVDRVGFPPYHAELMVDLITREAWPAWFAGETAAAESFAAPDDLSDFNRAMRAIVAGKALRDRVLADFAVVHPLAFGDPVRETTTFAEHRPSLL